MCSGGPRRHLDWPSAWRRVRPGAAIAGNGHSIPIGIPGAAIAGNRHSISIGIPGFERLLPPVVENDVGTRIA